MLQYMCYRLYLLLKQLFPESQGWYNSDHVITEIDGKFYDIDGETSKDKSSLTYLPIETWTVEELARDFQLDR